MITNDLAGEMGIMATMKKYVAKCVARYISIYLIAHIQQGDHDSLCLSLSLSLRVREMTLRKHDRLLRPNAVRVKVITIIANGPHVVTRYLSAFSVALATIRQHRESC